MQTQTKIIISCDLKQKKKNTLKLSFWKGLQHIYKRGSYSDSKISFHSISKTFNFRSSIWIKRWKIGYIVRSRFCNGLHYVLWIKSWKTDLTLFQERFSEVLFETHKNGFNSQIFKQYFRCLSLLYVSKVSKNITLEK